MAQQNDIYLFDEFKRWLKGEVTTHVASNYPSWLKKLNREFKSNMNTGSKDSPLEIIRKYLKKETKSGPNIRYLEELTTAIKSNLNKERIRLRNCGDSGLNEFNSEKSAFNSYVRFLEEYVESIPHTDKNLTQTQEATVINLQGKEIYLEATDLIDIFASRINSQDRNTGDKTFFPLGLVSKMLPRGTVRKWAKEEAAKVIIHLKDTTVSVNDIKGIVINTITKEVFVVLSDESKARVYEPALNGQRIPMLLNQIKDTDLDHNPEIHEILKKLKGSLPGLDLLTQRIIEKQKELGYKTINSKNYDKICDALYNDGALTSEIDANIISTLIDEIKLVSTKHILQLSSKEWNRSAKKQAKHNVWNTNMKFNGSDLGSRDFLSKLAKAEDQPYTEEDLYADVDKINEEFYNNNIAAIGEINPELAAKMKRITEKLK